MKLQDFVNKNPMFWFSSFGLFFRLVLEQIHHEYHGNYNDEKFVAVTVLLTKEKKETEEKYVCSSY